MSERALRIGLPILVLVLGLLVWDLVVRAFAIPPFVLPSPGLVLSTLIADGGLLWQSLLVTLATTFEGFLLAAVGGIGLAILFSQSRLVEYSLYPYAVILQVTPIVAIAPLLLIYLSQRIVVMTQRPGRVFTEIAIPAPYPRDERFRTSADYAGFCRLVSEALGQAMASGGAS